MINDRLGTGQGERRSFEYFFHRIDTDILLHFINAAPGDRLSFDSTPPTSLNARKSVFYFVSVNETHYMTALKSILRVALRARVQATSVNSKSVKYHVANVYSDRISEH